MDRWIGAGLMVAMLGLGPACDDARAKVPDASREVPDDSRRDRMRRPAELVAAMAILPGARIADVGAGDGYLTWRLAAAAGVGGRVVATDVDEVALGLLRARLGRLAREVPDTSRAPIEVRKVEAEDPGLEAAGYDLVVLAEVDQYLGDRTAFLTSLAAALAPGGRIAVSNREAYRAPLLAAAAAAGLVAREVAVELPAQFLVILTPETNP